MTTEQAAPEPTADQECQTCYGDGEIPCDECSGTGMDSDNEDYCDECEGSCNVDCPDCPDRGYSAPKWST